MWFLFNSAQRDHKNTDVYLTGFRIGVEPSLYPFIHGSYHTATGRQVSVSSTFIFHQTFMNIVIKNKHAVAKLRASPRKMLRTRLRGILECPKTVWSSASTTALKKTTASVFRYLSLGEQMLCTKCGFPIKCSVFLPFVRRPIFHIHTEQQIKL